MARAGVQWALVVFGICLFSELVQGAFYNVGVRYKVALNVYSGRENPDWEIDETDPLYDRISWMVNEGPPTPLDDNLGYEGFVVEATNAMGQKAWKTVGRHTNRKLESMLLRSCPSSEGLSQQVMNHVYSGIIGQYRKKVLPNSPMAKIVKQPIARVSITTNNDDDSSHIVIKQRLYRKKRQARVCSTRFQPENWNYGQVQRRNNCYNYATNIRTDTFAQPGRASGQRYRITQAGPVYAATLRDGLTPLNGPDAGSECLIALVIWPGEDYHFLRLDNNGYWSQKSGRTEARNVDDSGDLITDPRTCDRGPYTVFAGWLGVGPRASIR
ncbi:uncharacterized protein LOC123554486 [Mercenaria mercenaria]|uniref:uncharacterized protein LOC123554486 n=1 Tax=Mercenaria mercenaria TaxID=6596 RepID=UPI00234F65A9|nr:uncharacterized protein LOC123554486 [Mercenaria mercenaria]